MTALKYLSVKSQNNGYPTDIKQNYFGAVLELQNHFLKKLRVLS